MYVLYFVDQSAILQVPYDVNRVHGVILYSHSFSVFQKNTSKGVPNGGRYSQLARRNITFNPEERNKQLISLARNQELSSHVFFKKKITR